MWVNHPGSAVCLVLWIKQGYAPLWEGFMLILLASNIEHDTLMISVSKVQIINKLVQTQQMLHWPAHENAHAEPHLAAECHQRTWSNAKHPAVPKMVHWQQIHTIGQCHFNKTFSATQEHLHMYHIALTWIHQPLDFCLQLLHHCQMRWPVWPWIFIEEVSAVHCTYQP